MGFDGDLWPGDWLEIGTAAKDIAAHKGCDLAMARAALCRTAFSDAKINKRLVEYEWDEYRQVSVADRGRGIRVDVDDWPILGQSGIDWSMSCPLKRIQPKKGGDPRRTQKIEVYWPDIEEHILSRAPAVPIGEAGRNRKGRPPITMERVKAEMRAIDRNILKTLTQEEMRARFRVSRDVFVPARNAVLDEK
jgi:hypothetical protein